MVLREEVKKKGEKNMPKKTEKKEKDLSMTDESWNKRTGRITEFLNHEGNQEFLNSSDDIMDAVELINMNIRRGNRSADKRKNLWNQILIEGRDWTQEKGANVEMDWPVSIGKESNLPAFVQTSLKQIETHTFNSAVDWWNNNPIIQQTMVISDRNKELGGSPYPDATEFAKARAFANKQRFTKYYNDGRWNGEFNLETGFNVAPPPANEETEESGDSDEDSA
jgi:hypothetical protein|tara:strand:+ start:1080 stop:1748 length:669 start_codon:yes stop_codon:yes gene_type:complete